MEVCDLGINYNKWFVKGTDDWSMAREAVEKWVLHEFAGRKNRIGKVLTDLNDTNYSIGNDWYFEDVGGWEPVLRKVSLDGPPKSEEELLTGVYFR